MLTQQPDSGMCKEEVNFSYSKRPKSPEPAEKPLGNPSEKLYVGHLPFNVSKRELDELFGHYGALSNIEIKHGGYAFVQYENSQDAEDAVKALHNYLFEGKRLTVEFSNKKGPGGNSCLLCGVEGHWARDCPENKEKGLDVKSGKCFKCGSFGHLARFCRDAKIERPPTSPRFRAASPQRRTRGRSRSPPPFRDRSEGYPPYRRPARASYDGYYQNYPRDYDYYRYDYYRGYDEMYYRDRYREPFYDSRDGPTDHHRMDRGANRDGRDFEQRPISGRDYDQRSSGGRDYERSAASGREYDPRESQAGSIGRDQDPRQAIGKEFEHRPTSIPRDNDPRQAVGRDFDPRDPRQPMYERPNQRENFYGRDGDYSKR